MSDDREIVWRDGDPRGLRVGRRPDGAQVIDDRGVRWERDASWRWQPSDMLPTDNAAGWQG